MRRTAQPYPNVSTPVTFLWLDYETTGSDVRRDRPAQFAAVRTDAELREVGEPMVWFCQPALDCVPDAQACLITGITPQHCLAHGLPEYQFAARIEQALSVPGTIGVGYNSIRFDDEITRFMFWRNLIDPYSREWRNECSRWDLLDVVRMAYALRPDVLTWPRNAEGKPSFKLTDLTAANGVAHESAHDALSDVRATLALARLVRTARPKLFDFCLALRKKERVAAELGLPCTPADAKPFIHVSGMFAPERGCLAMMWPLAMHPTNKNELIAWDLAHDPTELATMNVDEFRLRLFTKQSDLPDGVTRLPIKTVHLNKSPMVVGNYRTLTPETAQRWGLDMDAMLRHAALARDLPDFSGIWPEVFARPAAVDVDVDEDLYGGFVDTADRRKLDALRARTPPTPSQRTGAFEDARLDELVFRYRARNFPDTLSGDELARWERHRAARLLDGGAGVRTVEAVLAQIDALSENADERGEMLLGELADWLTTIAPNR